MNFTPRLHPGIRAVGELVAQPTARLCGVLSRGFCEQLPPCSAPVLPQRCCPDFPMTDGGRRREGGERAKEGGRDRQGAWCLWCWRKAEPQGTQGLQNLPSRPWHRQGKCFPRMSKNPERASGCRGKGRCHLASRFLTGPARLFLGTTPCARLSPPEGFPQPLASSLCHPLLAQRRAWGRGTSMQRPPEGRAQPMAAAERSRLCLPAPCLEVKEKAKAFHIPVDAQLQQHSRRKGKAWGALISQLFPLCTHVPASSGEEGMQFSLITPPRIFSPTPTPKFRVEGNNFLTLATIHYVYGSAPHPIPPLFPVLMKGKNVLLSFFIFPDW